MVLQKAVNNLKQGSKDDKVAVASGIAVTVVLVLLAGWAIFFLRGIASGQHNLQLGGGAQAQFNPSATNDAQQQLQQDFSSSTDQFQDIYNQSAAGNNGGAMQTQQMQVQGAGGDQFGTPGSYQ